MRSKTLSWLDRDELRLLIACSAAYCTANTTNVLTPQLLFGAEASFGVSATAAGALATCESLLIGVLSILLGARALSLSPRLLVAGGTIILAVVNLVSAAAPSFGALFGLHMASGVAGGMVMYCATSVVATAKDPVRGYAVLTVAFNAYMAGLFASVPTFWPQLSGLHYLLVGGWVMALLLPAALLLPKRVEMPPPPKAGKGRLGLIIIALAATLSLVGGQAAVNYGYIIPLGMRGGMSEGEISMALGVASVFAGVASLSAPLLVRWLGQRATLVATLLIALVSGVLYATTTDPMVFRITTVLNSITGLIVVPFILGEAAELDPSGRAGGVLMGVMVVAYSLAPFIGGAAIDSFGLGSLAVLNGISFGAGLILAILVALQGVAAGRKADTGGVVGLVVRASHTLARAEAAETGEGAALSLGASLEAEREELPAASTAPRGS